MMKEVRTPKGSRFLLCERSRSDPRYAKYPPQPVVKCAGYEGAGWDDGQDSQGAGRSAR
jgi:hypothetical protein